MSEKVIIVGLGNPGVQYDHTRHNIGFRLVEFLVNERVLSDSSSSTLKPVDSWRIKWQARSLESKVELAGASSIAAANCEVVFLLPQTFMNLSGESVGPAWRWYNKGLKDFSTLLVVHDEVDLPLGRLQLKQGGGEAGHNGLKSISQVLGSREYLRLRVGVGRPVGDGKADGAGMTLASWVLAKFTQDEERQLPEIFERAGAGIRCWLKLLSKALVDNNLERNDFVNIARTDSGEIGNGQAGKQVAFKACQQLLNVKAVLK